jgi:uncharacterized membrane protein YjdF
MVLTVWFIIIIIIIIIITIIILKAGRWVVSSGVKSILIFMEIFQLFQKTSVRTYRHAERQFVAYGNIITK